MGRRLDVGITQTNTAMPKPKTKRRKGCKCKLTPEQRHKKKIHRELYKTIFINGKKKRVRRPPTIDGLPVDEFIAQNADPTWLKANGYYDFLHVHECDRNRDPSMPADPTQRQCNHDEAPPL